ncbi:hypothetical protein GN958_ATG06587 [Phytophthora infestans]|uniref:Uncharacterized protein n=1 Tax=Phytophthora infestans TaxID=4787 RepID=A0A8S9UTG3_PHYIN|nr:hypothetical protein GN958_ATG06587 [Phytophthora infestans]
MVQFEIDDTVLYAYAWASTRANLSVLHPSCLSFYTNASFNVTEDLLQHIAHHSEGHIINGLRDARYDVVNEQFPSCYVEAGHRSNIMSLRWYPPRLKTEARLK